MYAVSDNSHSVFSNQLLSNIVSLNLFNFDYQVEEFGVISNTRLINTCANIVKNKFSYAYPNQDFPYRPNHILECEFFLLENMDCCLVNIIVKRRNILNSLF